MEEEDSDNEKAKVQQELQEVEALIAEMKGRRQHLLGRLQVIEGREKRRKMEASARNTQEWHRTDLAWSNKASEVLRETFELEDWRPHQLAAINATMSGKDLILVLPTGGGKSLCYQLPSLLAKGFTLVVSPLISLMEDQVMSLEARGICAMMLSASSGREANNIVLAAMTDAKSPLKLLYVTPERLAKSKRFMTKLEKSYEGGRLQRVAIDEVHCCAQWGHDFRPDYKILGILKRQFPAAPLLGLTATATAAVFDDVINMLQIPDTLVMRGTFNRPNLFYEVRHKPDNQIECIEAMAKLIKSRFPSQSGIVYCFSQREAEKVAQELTSRGVRAASYHANIEAAHRSSVHKAWLSGRLQVVVATVAFGMGIDKPNVRFVLHHTLSKSRHNYYQESGRAGRDGQDSVCVVYYRAQDVFRQSTMVFTEQTGLDNLYRMVAYCQHRTACRRSVMADDFAEAWDAALCDGHCDNCRLSPSSEGASGHASGDNGTEEDITEVTCQLLKHLQKLGAGDQRVTGAKLAQSWSQALGGKCKLSRERAEYLIVHLVLEKYLREDFHFTPYSTISYIVAGPRSQSFLKNGTSLPRITVTERKRTAKSSSQPKKTSKATARSDSKPASGAAANGLGSSSRLEQGHSAESTQDVRKSGRKRQQVITIDSDSSGSEFVEEDSETRRKDTKGSRSKVRKIDISGEESLEESSECTD